MLRSIACIVSACRVVIKGQPNARCLLVESQEQGPSLAQPPTGGVHDVVTAAGGQKGVGILIYQVSVSIAYTDASFYTSHVTIRAACNIVETNGQS